MGTLYLVATPIGNLEDITARALRILNEVSLIAAEDTRQTRKLLSHFNIRTPITSYHRHSNPEKVAYILGHLEQGDVALVSDAGTPALNDPGYDLVINAIERDYPVTPIPGPCAPVAALIASGLPTDQFLYLGYLPNKSSQRRRFLTGIVEQPYTLVLLETPHRLISALADIKDVLGDREVAVARELTKIHEEIFRGSIQSAHKHFSAKEVLGEFTLVIAGWQPTFDRWTESRLRQAIITSLQGEETTTQIAARLAVESLWPRREIYRMLNEMKNLTE